MMKTSSTKRVLAFWLAVAILGAPASGAFAAGLTTLQSTVQAADTQAEVKEVKLEKSFGQTIQDAELKQALIDAKVATESDTVAYAVASDTTSKEVLKYGNSAVTFLKTGTGKITATITPAASATVSDSSSKTQDITITVTQADLSTATITLTDADNLVYDNTAKQPAVSKVSLNSVDLTSSSDYDVSYENNTNAGQASVKITGKGNYTGTATKNFNIGKANLTNLSSISPIVVNQNAGKEAVKQELDKQNIQADGVASERVSGTFELTSVEQTSKSPSDLDTFTQTPDNYIITATFTPTDNTNYNPKTDVKINCTVTPAESSFTVTEAQTHVLKNLTVGTSISDIELKSLVTVSPDTPDTYTYAVKGDLPAGLSESNGKISGTPQTAGTGSFTITVTDKQQVSKEATISYSVSAQASTAQVITLDSATIANGKVYDGNTNIDSKSIEVKLSGDTAAQAIRDTDYTVTGKFNDANVGTDKTVTVTVTLTDEGQKKYTFANAQKSATTTVNISI